jgi:hypothetical protein
VEEVRLVTVESVLPQASTRSSLGLNATLPSTIVAGVTTNLKRTATAPAPYQRNNEARASGRSGPPVVTA